jgi:transposase InsO family protein
MTYSRGGGGANGPTRTDWLDPAAACGTVGSVEGWGVFKRYRTSAEKGSVGYTQVVGLSRWYCPAAEAAIGAVIVDSGAGSHFPWPLYELSIRRIAADCDPQSPWQRGSNENTNGLLRQYFPKGTDLARHSHAELNRVAQRLNQRPRETLGFQTPAAKLRASVASIP